MSAAAIWLAGPARPLFCWLHLPAGNQARGGVLLCPPLARDYHMSHETYRLLAERLSEQGLAVLRPDYDGTGDSPGQDSDPDRVAAWRHSLAAGAGFLRVLGVPWLGVVAMRIGALLAVDAELGEDALVLWDPSVSGRQALREQRTVAQVRLPEIASDDDGVQLLGYHYGARTRSELEALSLRDWQPRTGLPVLVLYRREQPRASRLGGPGVQRLGIDEQRALLDEALPCTPLHTLREVADWLLHTAPEPAVGLRAASDTGLCSSDGVDLELHGVAIRERLVRLGPLGLVGICTEPSEPVAAQAPTVVLLNVATEHRIGPGRLWVELSRRWAVDGVRSVRVDLSGLGDSPQRPGQLRDRPFHAGTVDDIVAVATALHPDRPGNIILVGMCSSAYAALTAAPRIQAHAVAAVNPSLNPTGALLAQNDGRRNSSSSGGGSGGGGGDTSLVAIMVSRIKERPAGLALRRAMPSWAWRLADRSGLLPAPTRPLRRAIEAGAHALLICGTEELDNLTERGGFDLVRLASTGRLQAQYGAAVDHGLLSPRGRCEATSALTSFVATHTHRALVGDSVTAGGPVGPGSAFS